MSWVSSRRGSTICERLSDSNRSHSGLLCVHPDGSFRKKKRYSWFFFPLSPPQSQYCFFSNPSYGKHNHNVLRPVVGRQFGERNATRCRMRQLLKDSCGSQFTASKRSRGFRWFSRLGDSGRGSTGAVLPQYGGPTSPHMCLFTKCCDQVQALYYSFIREPNSCTVTLLALTQNQQQHCIYACSLNMPAG